jgi:glycosyltransferase involved in cell wall biosynthesis
MRLAIFTPWPPDRSGIAAYSAELLPALATNLDIDVFLANPAAHVTTADAGSAPHGSLRLRSAFEFQPLHLQAPYDLVVYQLGNARCHDYMWAYLVRYPGLVVLHDGQLHHSRARALIARGREADYRAEFAWCHPDAPPDLAEFVVNGLQGSPYFLWPLRGVALAAARALAVHAVGLADELRPEVPAGVPLVTIPMGTRPHAPARRADVHGRPVIAAFGGVTPEKRIPQVLRAFARALEVAPDARLLLVGETRDYYDASADARALGVESRVTITGYVADIELDDWIEAADICVCLRWPTSRETSASWLRCLAAGKATVTTDLVHVVDVPSLDPRTWNLQWAWSAVHDAVGPPGAPAPVCVGVDILDEDHSLGLALRRLAVDAELRATLGASGRQWWDARHGLAHMIAGYEQALAVATAAPVQPPRAAALPSHLRDEARTTLERLCAEIGVPVPLAGLGTPTPPTA